MAPTSAKIHDKVGEALEIGRVVCLASKLATHLRPDLDAVLAIWICQRIRKQSKKSPAEVVFIPASTTSVDSGTLALNMGIGKGVQRFGNGRSIKRSAIKGSVSMALYRALPDDDRALLDTIVQTISDAVEKGENIHTLNLQDSTFPDGTSRWDQLLLRHQITSTTMWAVFDNMATVIEDRDLVHIWGLVFDGILAAGLKKREAKQASGNVEFRFDGTLAILPHNAPQDTTKIIFGKGAKIAIFSSYLGADTWTLGVSRRRGDEARYIDLHDYQSTLKKYVPEIFVHPGGFMAGWTIKSPLRCSAEDFRDKREALIVAVSELVRNALRSKA